jgi:hypothetical protein
LTVSRATEENDRAERPFRVYNSPASRACFAGRLSG